MKNNARVTTTPKDSPQNNLTVLIQELLREPYANEQDFGDATIEGLGALLEEAAEELEQPNLPPEILPLQASYERCKDTYCRILMEAELQNISPLPTQLLKELSGGAAKAPELPPMLPDYNELPSLELDHESDDLILKEAEEEAEKLWADETDFKNRDAAPPEAPEEVEEVTRTDLHMKPKTPPPVPKAAQNILKEFEAVMKKPQPMVEDLTEKEEDRPPKAEEPTGEWRLAADPLLSDARKPEPAAEAEAVAARPLRIAPKPGAIEPPPHLPSTGKAKVYVVLAQYLRSLKENGSFPVPGDYADRLIAQNFCFAVELQCIEKLEQPLERFWTQRDALIPTLYEQEGKGRGLNPPLKRALDELATIHGDWLPEKKFPHNAVNHSLSYIAGYDREEVFQPALIDAGALILFFGEDRIFGKIALKNVLGIRGITNSEAVELAFRLISFQKLRNKVLNVGGEPGESFAKIATRVETEASALLKLLAKIDSVGHHEGGR